ncbi:MAG: fimbrillin family protein [Muribaculaceae bacterium]|nr:fimbrillin family protein [Muribaculaceae bacterium]
MVEINRYTHSKRNSIAARRAAAACAAIAMLTSCNDDIIPGPNGQNGDRMDFSVAITEAWQEAAQPSPQQKVNISRMETDGTGDQLYLITTITPQPGETTADSKPQSRGTSITAATFYDNFGLSALCYTSESLPGNATTYCDNIKMKKSGTKWVPDNNDTKISWLGSGRIRFFAYAPHNSATSAGVSAPTAGTGGIPQTSFTVNTSVPAQTDLLAAVTDTHGAAGGSVNLTFCHTLTAVNIKTGDAMLAGKFKSVSLLGVYGSGNLTADLDDKGNTVCTWATSGTTTSFTATLDTDGKVITPDNGTLPDNHYSRPGQSIIDGSLTFFMIPQTLPSGAKLRIVFEDELTGVERTLTADLSGKTWAAGQRVEYAVSSTGIKATPVFDIEFAVDTEKPLPYTGVIDVASMQAYMRVTQEGKDDVLLPLKLRFASSVDANTDCRLDLTGDAPADVTQKRSGTLRMIAQTPYPTEMRKPFDDLGLSAIYTTAADGSPMDLSRFNGREDDGRTESANTYVIRTPGLYKLPLVYGNSLNNEKAYKPGVTGYTDDIAPFIMENMVDHTNSPITHQWIADQYPGIAYEPHLLWQDSPELIRDIKLSDDRRYLQFEVREATLNQGNALIAIKDPATGDALWSWQIYVTHYDWSGAADVALTSRASGLTHHIAPANIGYCDMHAGAPERKQTLTVYATGADGKETAVKTVTFTQEGIAASSAGDNTYYQFLRKDPTPGGIYNPSVANNLLISGPDNDEEYNMINKPVWTPDGRKAIKKELSLVEYYRSIAAPDAFFSHDNVGNSQSNENNKARRIWCNNLAINLWDGLRTSYGHINSISADNDNKVQKTVYDPSPRGYNVPCSEAFTGLIAESVYNESRHQYPMWKITGTSPREWEDVMDENIPNASRIYNDGMTVGWIFDCGLRFYATGVRDMGTTHTLESVPESLLDNTWPAFRDLTFMAVANPQNSYLPPSPNLRTPQLIAFGLDNRHEKVGGVGMNVALSSNGGYGTPVRPERTMP